MLALQKSREKKITDPSNHRGQSVLPILLTATVWYGTCELAPLQPTTWEINWLIPGVCRFQYNNTTVNWWNWKGPGLYLPYANCEDHEVAASHVSFDQFGKILQHLNIVLLHSSIKTRHNCCMLVYLQHLATSSILLVDHIKTVQSKSPIKHPLSIYRHLMHQCDHHSTSR